MKQTLFNIVRIELLIFVLVFCFFSPNSHAGDREIKVVTVNHGNLESIHRLVVELQDDTGKATIHHDTDSIILVDSPENISRIIEVIEKIDKPRKQVLLSVHFIESSRESMSGIGISGDKSIIKKDDYFTFINLLEGDSKFKTQSKMEIRTLSGEAAEIFLGENRVFEESRLVYENGRTIISAKEQPVGNNLEVLPIVNGDGTINITLRPSSSRISSDNIIRENSLYTKVTVNNGDTVVIGNIDTMTSVTRSTFFDIKNGSKRSVNTYMLLNAAWE